MMKKLRQIFAFIISLVLYFLIHEGAHLIVALRYGIFEAIAWRGIGMQIKINDTLLNDHQLGIFCIVGFIATFIVSICLVIFSKKFANLRFKYLSSCFYYISLVFMLTDPAYLSFAHYFVGGGDMNGIVRLGISRAMASLIFSVILN